MNQTQVKNSEADKKKQKQQPMFWAWNNIHIFTHYRKKSVQPWEVGQLSCILINSSKLKLLSPGI